MTSWEVKGMVGGVLMVIDDFMGGEGDGGGGGS